MFRWLILSLLVTQLTAPSFAAESPGLESLVRLLG